MKTSQEAGYTFYVEGDSSCATCRHLPGDCATTSGEQAIPGLLHWKKISPQSRICVQTGYSMPQWCCPMYVREPGADEVARAQRPVLALP